MSCNIYIVFTRYQFICVQNLRKHNTDIKKSILISTVSIEPNDFEGKIYFFKKITSVKSLLDEIYTKTRQKAFLEVKDDASQYKDINVFIPHYFNIHSNYIATTLLPNANIHIIPDGILSFYPYELTKKDIIKQFINKVVALSIGLKYKLFFTNIVDPFSKVVDIYSYDPSITYTYGKNVKQIPYLKNNIFFNNKTLVILGTSSKINNISAIKQKILNLIQKNKINKIYYKIHPSQLSDLMYENLLKEIDNLTLLVEPLGIENLVEKYHLNIIVSVEFSTALLEIQRQYDCKLDCYINNSTTMNKSKYKKYFDLLLKYYQIKELR